MPLEKSWSIALTLLLALPAEAVSQTAVPLYRARLIGVYDELSGEPLQGVKVSDALTGASALTTATGTVSLIFLPDGGSLVRLQKIGYETQTFPVSISARDTLPVTMTMKHVTQLPTMVTTDSQPHYISPALRGFLARKKIEWGTFIDEAELRKNEGRQLANLLRAKAPGAQFADGPGGAMYLLKAVRCSNGGPPQVYLDGVPLASDPPPLKPSRRPNAQPPATITPFDLSHFSVSDLAAVEYYADGTTVPIEFAHTSQRCGALLLWTRER